MATSWSTVQEVFAIQETILMKDSREGTLYIPTMAAMDFLKNGLDPASMRQERALILEEVALLLGNGREVDIAQEIPLQTIFRAHIHLLDRVNHVLKGMLNAREINVFVKSSSSSKLRDSKLELTVIRIRFLYATLMKSVQIPKFFRLSQLEALLALEVRNSDFMPMKILCWNCRRAAHHEFISNIMEYVDVNNLMLVFITETRLPASQVESIRTLLHFDSANGIDVVGLSGGIWALWDSNRLEVDILPHGRQTLHLILKVKSNVDFSNSYWLCSGIYASTHLADRLMLWDELKTISDHYLGPWALIGDFNEVVTHNEKSGGARLNNT